MYSLIYIIVCGAYIINALDISNTFGYISNPSRKNRLNNKLTYYYGDKIYDSYKYNYDSPTYIVISNQNKHFIDMSSEMKKNRINYLFMNLNYFTLNEIEELRDYGLDLDKIDIYSQPVIFSEDCNYFGGAFEMYDVIFRSSNCE